MLRRTGRDEEAPDSPHLGGDIQRPACREAIPISLSRLSFVKNWRLILPQLYVSSFSSRAHRNGGSRQFHVNASRLDATKKEA